MFKRIWAYFQVSIIFLTIIFGILYFFNNWFKYLFIFFLDLSFFEMFINSYNKKKMGWAITYFVFGLLFLIIFVILL